MGKSRTANNNASKGNSGWLIGKCLLTLLLTVLIAFAVYVEYIRTTSDVQEITEISEFSVEVQSWYQRGKFYEVLGHQMFAIDEGKGPNTVILIHGFPTSSFDFHKVIQKFLDNSFRVVTFDHLGFGFSDKPNETYVYSMADQAEMCLKLWQMMGVKEAHIVSHDMGDSVLTEILTRRHRNMLPDYFDNFFKSITFTNGGMVYEHINMRMMQILLTKPIVGPFFAWLQNLMPSEVLKKVSSQQLQSIWSPKYGNKDQMIKDINNIQDLLNYKRGDKIMFKTISYLKDRARFEPRWLDSLSHLDIPCLLFWGDSDSVAPMKIAIHLAQHVLPQKYFVGKTLKDVGHFGMLEAPVSWAQTIMEFIKSNTKK